MRVMVFFDLPTETAQNRKEYSKFRKFLIKCGFMMMQESVYCKLVLNGTAQASVIAALRNNRPGSGIVQVLTVTENQFSKMEYLVGEYRGDVVQSDERLVEL